MKKHYTIGMAGHIDHGKTTLTKALTNVDTDRLKEEKERQISIELGFAPLLESEDMEISVIDVPGHERFIRQMIAGVSGIDLVVLVVAADEGVMPQTKEHLEILNFLGVKGGIVAITKIDRVEEGFLELVKEEIALELEGSIFEDSPIVMVDSLSHKGIEELKESIYNYLKKIEGRDTRGAFRLPIDSVFTVKGQGTVVRGTVYEGTISEGEELIILPKGLPTKARQIQVHHKPASKAYAGQRAAINLSSLSKDDVKRGDVVVSSEHFIVTKIIDVAVKMVDNLEYLVKQRMPIKCHIGTSEVMGRIVFFDRNELTEEKEEILCQLRLNEDIVTKRGDRFILRRPSPPETIGGGWVIDPNGKKYRFGEKTIQELQRKKLGNPKDRALEVVYQHKCMKVDELATYTSLPKEEVASILQEDEFILFTDSFITHKKVVEAITEDLYDFINDYHNQHPMRYGMNKAELISEFSQTFPKQLIQFVIEEGERTKAWIRNGQFLSTRDFSPHIPKNWEKRVENMLKEISKDGMEVRYLENYLEEAGIPESMWKEMKYFLVEHKKITPLNEKYYLDFEIYEKAVQKLKENTSTIFTVQEAKDILGLSRKYIIPFLEKLDHEKRTKRQDNNRVWI
jgi:selenocysteine-specific elongation factor